MSLTSLWVNLKDKGEIAGWFSHRGTGPGIFLSRCMTTALTIGPERHVSLFLWLIALDSRYSLDPQCCPGIHGLWGFENRKAFRVEWDELSACFERGKHADMCLNVYHQVKLEIRDDSAWPINKDLEETPLGP